MVCTPCEATFAVIPRVRVPQFEQIMTMSRMSEVPRLFFGTSEFTVQVRRVANDLPHQIVQCQ